MSGEEKEANGADRPMQPHGLCFGSFAFDPRRQELLRHGRPISMSASQRRLLTLFVERRGEVVTREEIAERLWADTGTIDVATGINTAVNRLRRNLQEAPGATSPIETVIGLGYRFDPVLNQVEPTEDAFGQVDILAEPSEALPQMAPRQAVSGLDTDPGLNIPLREVPQGDTLDQSLHYGKHSEDLETRDIGLRRPPGHIPPAGARPWMLAAVAACILILCSAFGFFAMRRPATRAGSAPPPIEAVAAKSSAVSALVRVTANQEAGKITAAAVSPSGQLVAYADPSGISVHSFPLSANRLLGSRPSFTVDRLSWFPNESGLLASGTDEKLHRQQVWFAPLNSPYASLVAENATRATLSPDGGKMAFLRNENHELWEAAADGQHPRLLRRAAEGETYDLVLWTPAGNRLLATVGKPHAGAYEFLDAESGNLVHRAQGFTASSGYFLQNGSFSYIENANPVSVTTSASIMEVQLDLSSGRMIGAPHRVRDLDGFAADTLSASLTGTRTSMILQQTEVDVFVAELGKSGQALNDVTRLSRDARETFPHSWTADGEGILVESDSVAPGVAPKWALFKQPVDGTKATLLASPPGSPAMAQLTPDGRWILFLEYTDVPQQAKGVFQIPATGLFRMPATGGPMEQVRTTGVIENFRCSASAAGRCVVRESVGNKEFVYYALDALQGMGEELGRTAWQPRMLGDWGLSADGSTVAVVSHDILRPHISLFRFGTGPSQAQDIALRGHGTTLAATWAPDGKSLYVECQTEGGYELVTLDLAGHVKLLRKSPLQIWAIPSRDGSKIAFPDLTLNSSLWTTDGRP